jgi:hypothetical protein
MSTNGFILYVTHLRAGWMRIKNRCYHGYYRLFEPLNHSTHYILTIQLCLKQTSPYRVRGCILTVVERMDEEFTKMLQACDAHSTEYVDR